MCVYAGFCSKKKSTPMLKLQPAMTVPAVKSVPAAKLFPATKVESAPVQSAMVEYWSRLPPDALLCPLIFAY